MLDDYALGALIIPGHYIIIPRVFSKDTFDRSTSHTSDEINIWPRSGFVGWYSLRGDLITFKFLNRFGNVEVKHLFGIGRKLFSRGHNKKLSKVRVEKL